MPPPPPPPSFHLPNEKNIPVTHLSFQVQQQQQDRDTLKHAFNVPPPTFFPPLHSSFSGVARSMPSFHMPRPNRLHPENSFDHHQLMIESIRKTSSRLPSQSSSYHQRLPPNNIHPSDARMTRDWNQPLYQEHLQNFSSLESQTRDQSFERFKTTDFMLSTDAENDDIKMLSSTQKMMFQSSSDVKLFDDKRTSNETSNRMTDDSQVTCFSDECWIKNWIETKKKKISKDKENSVFKKTMSLTSFRNLLLEAIKLNDHLKSFIIRNEEDEKIKQMNDNRATDDHLRDDDQLKSSSETQSIATMSCEESDQNENRKLIAGDIQYSEKRLIAIKNMLNKEVVSSIKAKLKKISIKRRRLKCKKRRENEEEKDFLLKRLQIDQSIDKWQTAILSKELKMKKDREMKMAVDEILGEVRKKLIEAKRCLNILTHLRKLRNLRKDKCNRKGIHLSIVDTTDSSFEERVRTQTEVLKRQIDMYELEERTLKVMLETEQEADLEREIKIQKRKEDEKMKNYEMQIKKWIFGEELNISPTDILYPYHQYYNIGSVHLGAFIRIRHEWDMYAVPNGTLGGSSVPFGWVIPMEPSSDIWASVALQDNDNKSS